jgi:hypothetical protein
VVATGGNQQQIASGPEAQEQAKTVAVGCDQLPENGKEGVDGSSPSEGSKIPAKRGFLLSSLVLRSTSTARRGSRVEGGSTTQRVAGNHQRFLGAPAALRSWGQVLGTNDGWLGPNGSSARPIHA